MPKQNTEQTNGRTYIGELIKGNTEEVCTNTGSAEDNKGRNLKMRVRMPSEGLGQIVYGGCDKCW